MNCDEDTIDEGVIFGFAWLTLIFGNSLVLQADENGAYEWRNLIEMQYWCPWPFLIAWQIFGPISILLGAYFLFNGDHTSSQRVTLNFWAVLAVVCTCILLLLMQNQSFVALLSPILDNLVQLRVFHAGYSLAFITGQENGFEAFAIETLGSVITAAFLYYSIAQNRSIIYTINAKQGEQIVLLRRRWTRRLIMLGVLIACFLLMIIFYDFSTTWRWSVMKFIISSFPIATLYFMALFVRLFNAKKIFWREEREIAERMWWSPYSKQVAGAGVVCLLRSDFAYRWTLQIITKCYESCV